MYGMGPVNLSRQLGISFKQASEFIETYFRQFPTIRSFMDSCIEKARRAGYSETILGRRRYLPEINSESRQIREGAERIAINTPVQGTAADIIKIAMVAIHREMSASPGKAKLLLQVHDELVFEAPENDVDRFREWVAGKMSSALKLDVPLKVDTGAGKNWSLAH
jgi:DNA polymerase-1